MKNNIKLLSLVAILMLCLTACGKPKPEDLVKHGFEKLEHADSYDIDFGTKISTEEYTMDLNINIQSGTDASHSLGEVKTTVFDKDLTTKIEVWTENNNEETLIYTCNGLLDTWSLSKTPIQDKKSVVDVGSNLAKELSNLVLEDNKTTYKVTGSLNSAEAISRLLIDNSVDNKVISSIIGEIVSNSMSNENNIKSTVTMNFKKDTKDIESLVIKIISSENTDEIMLKLDVKSTNENIELKVPRTIKDKAIQFTDSAGVIDFKAIIEDIKNNKKVQEVQESLTETLDVIVDTIKEEIETNEQLNEIKDEIKEGIDNLVESETNEDKTEKDNIHDILPDLPTFTDYFKNSSIIIDWIPIELPCSYSNFEDVGWTWCYEMDSERELDAGREYTADLTNGKIDSSDLKFYATFINETDETQLLSDCTLYQITIIASNNSVQTQSILLPGGLLIGDSLDKVKSYYGTPKTETENKIIYEDTENRLYISIADKDGFGINEIVISRL